MGLNIGETDKVFCINFSSIHCFSSRLFCLITMYTVREWLCCTARSRFFLAITEPSIRIIILLYNDRHYALLAIGVIYGGTRGTGAPTFWTEGYRTPTFQDEKVKNLLSPAVSRGDLRRLNYNKTIFGRGSALDPARRAHDALPDPRVGWEELPLPYSPPLSSRDERASCSPSELVPPLFRPKLRFCCYRHNLILTASSDLGWPATFLDQNYICIGDIFVDALYKSTFHLLIYDKSIGGSDTFCAGKSYTTHSTSYRLIALVTSLAYTVLR